MKLKLNDKLLLSVLLLIYILGTQLLMQQVLENHPMDLSRFPGNKQAFLVLIRLVVIAFALIFSALQAFIYVFLYRIILKKEMSFSRMYYYLILATTPIVILGGIISSLDKIVLITNKIYQAGVGILPTSILLLMLYFYQKSKGDTGRHRFLIYTALLLGINVINILFRFSS